MLRKLYRAWRFYTLLDYSWRLAWYKALREKAPGKALNDAILEMKLRHLVIDPRRRAVTQRDRQGDDTRA